MTGPELRIGDAEREAAVHALGEHYAAGRLSKDEFDERSGRAYDARTVSALDPLFADLPGRPQAQARPTAPRGPAPQPQGHPGWRSGAFMLPLFLLVLGLVLLTHLPFFLLLVVGWIMFAKLSGHWARRAGWRHHHGYGRGPGARSFR